MSQITYSEHGEDILIHRLFGWKGSGCYLDVGAYHPLKMSMTARLYLHGWSGINIDADERAIDIFDQYRPNDLNLNIAISNQNSTAKFFVYEDGVINTLSESQQNHLIEISNKKSLFTSFIYQKVVNTQRLDTVLDNYNNIKNIDYFNIDVEGLELNVLSSFPWSKFCPLVISIEVHKLNFTNCNQHPVVIFLNTHGYRLQSYVLHTAIFVKQDYDDEEAHKKPFYNT